MFGEKLITILTPTYNRGQLLLNLYNSLLKQTKFDFEWLIIDDGSTDNTKEVVKIFNTTKFKIKYVFKKNGGKHTALNEGINIISTKLTFIVDSDDWLLSTAIENIIKIYEEYKNTEQLAGFSFLRQYPDGKINVSMGRTLPFIDNYSKIRIKENRIGDMAEVYYTNVLRKYPFPVFEDEKFLSEEIVWIEIAKKYNLLFIEESIYVSNYLESGLTRTRRKIMYDSPKGSYLSAIKILSIENLPFYIKIKYITKSIIFGKINRLRIKDIGIDNYNVLLSYLLYPFICVYLMLRRIL